MVIAVILPESDRFYFLRSHPRMKQPCLGRPPANVSPEKKKQAREDEKIRNAIE